MYPNNQTIEIFGEEVQWPGVDESGKFTNGSFTDPMVKPSFIGTRGCNTPPLGRIPCCPIVGGV
jgi:hypothetical protein